MIDFLLGTLLNSPNFQKKSRRPFAVWLPSFFKQLFLQRELDDTGKVCGECMFQTLPQKNACERLGGWRLERMRN